MKTIGTRILTSVLMLSLVSVSFLPVLEQTTPKAHAQVPIVPTIEMPGPLLTAVIASTAAETTTAGATSLQAFFDEILDGLAWTVAKVAIQSMTRSIVVWINNGFDGSPAFVTDLRRNLGNLADGVARDFLNQLTAQGMIDSPFLERVALGVGAAYYANTSSERLASRLRYTLNQYSRNDQAFLDGDFEEGGFNAWFATWMFQQNNPIGAHFIVGAELASNIEAEAFERLQDFINGRGFLSWKGKCKAYDTPALGEGEKCLQYETLTPGSVVESQLNITLQSPLKQLELADSVNEIVGALAVQLVAQVLGAAGLRGVSTASAGGGPSYLDRATNPNVYASSTASMSGGLMSRMQAERSSLLAHQTDWQKIRSGAETAYRVFTSGTATCADRDSKLAQVTSVQEEARAALTRINSALSTLDGLISRAQQASSGNQAALSTVGNDYLAFLSSGNRPGESDYTYAKNNAADTSGSLYSQMLQIAEACGR